MGCLRGVDVTWSGSWWRLKGEGRESSFVVALPYGEIGRQMRRRVGEQPGGVPDVCLRSQGEIVVE